MHFTPILAFLPVTATTELRKRTFGGASQLCILLSKMVSRVLGVHPSARSSEFPPKTPVSFTETRSKGGIAIYSTARTTHTMNETSESVGDESEWCTAPCYHCARYQLWGCCAQYPKQISYAILVGDKDCVHYRASRSNNRPRRT